MPESGGTPEQRRDEAERLLKIIEADRLEGKDASLVARIRGNFARYKGKTLVSTSELFWLRDIRDRQL